MISPELNELLLRIEAEGAFHDAKEPEHSRRLLNLERPTAELVSLLLQTFGSKRVLEVGTSNGYSTIWLAWTVAQQGGQVMTLERSAEKQEQAKANLASARLIDYVEFRCGDATELVSRLDGMFDAIFFDADRWSAPAQLDFMLPRLTRRCIVMADNALSHPDEIADYLAFVSQLQEFRSTIVPVGKGLSVAIRS